ncbi:MAG: glycine--tRNA ligase [Erysipelotrichaceae bacterium]|nr:glycine--tRNA ligase [Erysipelotrichaceae bacterium]
MSKEQFDKIVNHAKVQGFVYPGSEIYGGLANSWDFGPLGVEMKNNIKKAWWKRFVSECKYNVGLDSSIILNPKVWEASGHVATFSDPLIDCKYCKSRYRADKLIEEYDSSIKASQMSNEELEHFIQENVVCPKCGHKDYTTIRNFQLMFKTSIGVVEDQKSQAYLRPETAQGIFINFKNVARTTRKKIPFGVAQIGKAFRNEITPGNFIFRIREFEQMEMEFFCKPGSDSQWYDFWKNYCIQFLYDLGIKKDNLKFVEYAPTELAHYAKATSDILYNFPFSDEFEELWGIANRTDYDLSKHQSFSNENLTYLDSETNERYIPYVIEPSVGVERLMLALLCDSYDEEVINEKDTRVVMHLHPSIAPYVAAVLPLSKNLSGQANEIYDMLAKEFHVDYDETASIGKRYRREDAIGTPYCITIDFDTINDHCVTIRDRDTMKQERINIDDIVSFLREKIKL